MVYSRTREFVARRKGTDPAALVNWRGHELASRGWLLSFRVLCGSFPRLQLGHVAGLVHCERPRSRARTPRHRWPRPQPPGRLPEEGAEQAEDRGRRPLHCSPLGADSSNCRPWRPSWRRTQAGRQHQHRPLLVDPLLGLSRDRREGAHGSGVKLLSETCNIDVADVPIESQGMTRQYIVIELDCWLGAGRPVVADVTIGHDSCVATDAVITWDLPPYVVVGGVPARGLRTRHPGKGFLSTGGGEGATPAPLS